jgi:peptidoglycan/LPS O-acetylase OafA/YrhL
LPCLAIAPLGQALSIYLLHFPLQLIAVWTISRLGYSRSVFGEPTVLVAFFAVLILTSRLTYRYFERPMQSWVKLRLLA